MKWSILWTWPKQLWDLVRPYFPRSVDQLAVQAATLLPAALPIVKGIAALTPTRSDDELIALWQEKQLPAIEAWLALPPAERGRALAFAAARELKRYAPDVVDRVIDLAVQMAYTGWRAEQEA